jgi:transglutaminase-like putative cysteine protease
MKRIMFLVLLLMCLLFLFSYTFASTQLITFKPEEGVVQVNYQVKDYKPFKLLVKMGQEQYVYNLHKADEKFPLQMGEGTYTVALYENVSGNKYRVLTSVSKTVKPDPKAVFLASVQNISWDEKMEAVALAAVLTEKGKTEREKFDEVYRRIIKTIVYDYDKAATVSSRYLPVIDRTLEEQKGICYDYSSLMAGMLRSLGIQARLVEGQSTYTSVYHAWNEVYVGGKWIIIDSTIDAQLLARGLRYTVEKTIESHRKVKTF